METQFVVVACCSSHPFQSVCKAPFIRPYEDGAGFMAMKWESTFGVFRGAGWKDAEIRLRLEMCPSHALWILRV
jgi:hypothetical protein